MWDENYLSFLKLQRLHQRLSVIKALQSNYVRYDSVGCSLLIITLTTVVM